MCPLAKRWTQTRDSQPEQSGHVPEQLRERLERDGLQELKANKSHKRITKETAKGKEGSRRREGMREESHQTGNEDSDCQAPL